MEKDIKIYMNTALKMFKESKRDAADIKGRKSKKCTV